MQRAWPMSKQERRKKRSRELEAVVGLPLAITPLLQNGRWIGNGRMVVCLELEKQLKGANARGYIDGRWVQY